MISCRSDRPRDASEIVSAVQAFARSAKGGLIVTAGPAIAQRNLIFKLTAQHQLPASYFNRLFVEGGGLMSYGPDLNAPQGREACRSAGAGANQVRSASRWSTQEMVYE